MDSGAPFFYNVRKRGRCNLVAEGPQLQGGVQRLIEPRLGNGWWATEKGTTQGISWGRSYGDEIKGQFDGFLEARGICFSFA